MGEPALHGWLPISAIIQIDLTLPLVVQNMRDRPCVKDDYGGAGSVAKGCRHFD